MSRTISLDSTAPENYFDLGGHGRVITTRSEAAQYWFNHGLNWSFAFNQEEGVRCFRKALEHDPECAMAYWGVAYAAGPFYNMPWCDFGETEKAECTRLCFENTRKALEHCAGASDAEVALINALAQRFQADHPVSPREFNAWDDAYADAMRETWRRFPEDLDVIALFAEAMMMRTPWKLWNVRDDTPAQNADTLECLEVLEKAIALADAKGLPQHPAVLHLHIHALEMSGEPERALRSADVLGTLCPEAGHMNHMPGHIYMLCGLYHKARQVSEKAIAADRLYRDYAGDDNFYTTSRCHDLHMMMDACMFLGQYRPALAAAREMCAMLTRELIATPGRPLMTDTLEGYYSMKMHVMVRFGRWRDIIDEPMPGPADLYLASTAMWYYAKGIAHATLGQFEQAEQCQRDFLAARGRVPPERKIFNNQVVDILTVAEHMLAGEMEYHKGNHDVAFEHLRRSVELDDALAYSEPWAWMHPPRHALGALLLEQGHVAEAEAVYRADLGLSDELYRCARHPDNIWSLRGLLEILKPRGEDEQYTRLAGRYAALQRDADQEIASSCCCRKNVVSLD